MSGIRAAAAMAAFSLSIVPPVVFSALAGEGSASPPVEVVSAQDDPVHAAVSHIREGGGILLIAPGLQYYSAFAVSGADLRVVQVTPGREPLGEVQFEGWKKAVPVPPEAASFQDGKVTARFGNTEVTVVALDWITVPGARSVVLLDPDFFLPLYENEVRGGIVDLSMKLYRSLVEAGAAGFPLVIVNPLSSRSFPLQWAYAGALWAEVWQHPEAFRNGLPSKWKMRKDSEFLAEFGQFEESARILDEARPLFPKDGSLDFQLARLAFWDREIPVGIRFLNRATRIDRRFLRGYSEFAEYLVSKERAPAAEMVLRAGLSVDRSDPALNAGLFRLLLERSEALKSVDPVRALADLEQSLSLSVPEEMKLRARAIVKSIRLSVPR